MFSFEAVYFELICEVISDIQLSKWYIATVLNALIVVQKLCMTTIIQTCKIRLKKKELPDISDAELK